MRALLVLAIAGCGTAPLPPPLAGSSPAGQTPAPMIGWDTATMQFTTDRLPAISADGRAIVLGITAQDSMRGNPNLTIVVRDRFGATTQEHVVVGADESETMYDDQAPYPALVARIDAGNAVLARLHRSLDLHPLPEATTEVAVVVERKHHTVTDRGRVLLDRPNPKGWLPPEPAERCGYRQILHHAWVDLARRAAVIELRYSSGSICGHPEAQHHVLVW